MVPLREEENHPLPHPHPHLTMLISPRAIRGMAGSVIRRCIDREGNTDGFITLNFENMAAFAVNSPVPSNAPYRKSSKRNNDIWID